MSDKQIQDSVRRWGGKALYNSEFRNLALLIDLYVDRQPKDMSGLAALSAAVLKTAFMDAEGEVIKHPDACGIEQTYLLVPPRHGVDLIDRYCTVLGLDSEFLREEAANILDRIADKVRAQRAERSSKVVCLTSQRERQRESRYDPSLIFLVETGRYTGQYALAI